MSNPFEEILSELSEIKQTISIIRSSPAQSVEIIDRPELLRRLAITEPTAIRYGKLGKIPEIRLGSSVRYNWAAVVAALEKSK